MWLRQVAVLILVATLSGCSQVSYYLQATSGQIELIRKRQPVTDLITNPATTPELKRKLELATRIRAFASSDLGLPDNKTFQTYTDIERPYVTWNVVATPRYSLAAKTWCFPVAGCVAYKGYFSEAGAQKLNRELLDQEYDTFVYGVTAYSTLGWFSDPLLNTFLSYPESNLAALLFHELAHQQVYVKDDSDFNEAFATAVELEGLQRWLRQNTSTDKFDQYRSYRTRDNRITAMVLQYRETLQSLYNNQQDESVLESGKQQLFRDMINQYGLIKASGMGTQYYDWWFAQSLNNAHLLSVATYYQLVPAFTELLKQQEYDLSRFYQRVSEIGKLPNQARQDLLLKLVN